MIELKDISKLNLYVRIENIFFRMLVKSIVDNPTRNKNFSKKLSVYYNERLVKSPIICGWYYYGKSIPIDKLAKIVKLSKYSWKDIENNLIGITVSGNGRPCFIKPKFPITIDKKLGTIVGHLMGDGSIDKKYLQVFFSNTNKELLKEFQGNMKNVFGIEPRIWVQKRISYEKKTEWLCKTSKIEGHDGHSFGLFYPSSIGLILNTILGDFAVGHNKKITKKIKSSNKEFIRNFLRAFLDDEASVTPNSHAIRVFQDSAQLLEDIKSLLSKFGIRTNPIRSYVKRDKERYYFNITGLKNYRKLFSEIGFSSTEKKERLEKLIENVENSKTLRLEKGVSKNLIHMILKEDELTAKEIAEKLRVLEPEIKWNINSVHRHLRYMESKNKIYKTKKGRGYFWKFI